MFRIVLAIAFVTALATGVSAQHDHSGHNHAPGEHNSRVPSGLTASDAEGLLSGAGLGMARPAEVNGYPGPLHVLELAEPLLLTDEQRETAEQLRAEMLEEAIPLGRQLIDAERSLDAVFLSGTATTDDVERAVAIAAAAHARLRAVHLRTHLAMRDAMTDDQIAAYARLRGYE
ncbi:hypothetical protein, partial [Rubrivirga sp.]|uniref:hypothetical protein n=1 Tax=Rubrivirga sp. TaxID=1885344 RepID=UPI003C794B23